MVRSSGIGVEQVTPVRRDRGAVGDAIAVVDPSHGAVAVQPIEGAGRTIGGERHRARPDAAGAVRLGIVHAVAVAVRFGGGQRLERERIQRQRDDLTAVAGDEAGLIAPFDQPADRLRRLPTLDPLIVERQPVDPPAQNVGPIDRAVTIRPQQPFTEPIAAIARDDANAGHQWLSRGRPRSAMR